MAAVAKIECLNPEVFVSDGRSDPRRQGELRSSLRIASNESGQSPILRVAHRGNGVSLETVDTFIVSQIHDGFSISTPALPGVETRRRVTTWGHNPSEPAIRELGTPGDPSVRITFLGHPQREVHGRQLEAQLARYDGTCVMPYTRDGNIQGAFVFSGEPFHSRKIRDLTGALYKPSEGDDAYPGQVMIGATMEILSPELPPVFNLVAVTKADEDGLIRTIVTPLPVIRRSSPVTDTEKVMRTLAEVSVVAQTPPSNLNGRLEEQFPPLLVDALGMDLSKKVYRPNEPNFSLWSRFRRAHGITWPEIIADLPVDTKREIKAEHQRLKDIYKHPRRYLS